MLKGFSLSLRAKQFPFEIASSLVLLAMTSFFSALLVRNVKRTLKKTLQTATLPGKHSELIKYTMPGGREERHLTLVVDEP